ncbi:MAG: AI-2E family transporter [Pseudohongiellaceae bacterium]
MRKLFRDFYDRYFHDEESIILLILLTCGLVILATLGGVLAPLITAIIIAYLMQGLVNLLVRYHVKPLLAFVLVYALFVSIFLGILLILMPQVWIQMARFVNELPRLIGQWQASLLLLPDAYPNLITDDQIRELINGLRGELAAFGQLMVTYSITSIPVFVTWIIFIVLVPILVFFVMKDKDQLVSWTENFLPRNRPLMTRIWQEMDQQIANYIRGKVVEIIIMGSVSYIVFTVLQINYALLLSVLVAFSVLIPYIGATVVTIPVAAVAYVQWGLSGDFYTVLLAYAIMQLIDGNMLVPIIFSEAVNLHPVAIIAAVLVFGGLWGLAGVFFAIPLATLIKAIVNAWPSRVQSRADRSGRN